MAVSVGAVAFAVPGSAFRKLGHPWPTGVIPFYNAAHDQSWAVNQAVNAWNTSGARVRFVPVSRESAKLVIEHATTRSCTRAEATVGYRSRSVVKIWSSRLVSASCSPAWAAGAMAHELGHVLGLTHEDRGCAAMNSVGSERGPFRCNPVERWEWRCRLLEHDDIAGAVAIYGGRARVKPAVACPIYAAIAPPRFESAVLEAGLVTVRLRRPASPSIPIQLTASLNSEEAYAFAWGRGSCPTRIDLRRSRRFVWPRSADGRVEIRQRAPATAGRYCLSIWAVDSFVRPSDQPTTVAVAVP
jgi:Astacin (Peptidase family M12A)